MKLSIALTLTIATVAYARARPRQEPGSTQITIGSYNACPNKNGNTAQQLDITYVENPFDSVRRRSARADLQYLTCTYQDGSSCTFSAQGDLTEGDCMDNSISEDGGACYSAFAGFLSTY